MKSSIAAQGASAITPAAPYLTATDYYRSALLPYQQDEAASATRARDASTEWQMMKNEAGRMDLDDDKALRKSLENFKAKRNSGIIRPDPGGVPAAAPSGPTMPSFVDDTSNPANNAADLEGSGFSPAPSVASAIAPSPIPAPAPAVPPPANLNKKLTIEEAEALPSGTHFIGVDGEKYIRN